MAIKTKAQILAEISSLLADNTTGDISAQDVRTVVNDITDSYEDIITAGTTSQYWRGDKTWQNFPTNEVTGTLSAAQINALDTTPIQLIAAPGANKYIFIENTTVYFKYATTQYTTAAGLILYYNNNSEQINQCLGTATLQGTASKIESDYSTTLLIYSNTIINSAVMISCPLAISGGDSTVDFSIKYRIVTTS